VRIRRLSWLELRTDRMAEAVAFFRDRLGLEPIVEEDGHELLRLGDDFVELLAAERPETVPGLLVDDVVAARAELEAAGVELLDEIAWTSDRAYGWFRFRGPDGNVWGVMQGPSAGG
jgi:catechol 2,3-dioxygenase-like lactoylglutathione lyase family enzyme